MVKIVLIAVGIALGGMFVVFCLAACLAVALEVLHWALQRMQCPGRVENRIVHEPDE